MNNGPEIVYWRDGEQFFRLPDMEELSKGTDDQLPIHYQGRLVGLVEGKTDEDFMNFFGPILDTRDLGPDRLSYNFSVFEWLLTVRTFLGDCADWIGVYFKESYLFGGDEEMLVLGPYIGKATEHTRIPLSKGLCGLALREERIVNVADVTKESEHIACSLTTRSEIIIPIRDQQGNFVAELDIDSDTLGAFDEYHEFVLERFCNQFPLLNS